MSNITSNRKGHLPILTQVHEKQKNHISLLQILQLIWHWMKTDNLPQTEIFKSIQCQDSTPEMSESKVVTHATTLSWHPIDPCMLWQSGFLIGDNFFIKSLPQHNHQWWKWKKFYQQASVFVPHQVPFQEEISCANSHHPGSAGYCFGFDLWGEECVSLLSTIIICLQLPHWHLVDAPSTFTPHYHHRAIWILNNGFRDNTRSHTSWCSSCSTRGRGCIKLNGSCKVRQFLWRCLKISKNSHIVSNYHPLL